MSCIPYFCTYANYAWFQFSLLSWEKARREFFPLWLAKDFLEHIPNIKCKFVTRFWKLVLPMSTRKYVVDKLNNRFTVSKHFVLADKHSLTKIEFCLLAHPHIKQAQLRLCKLWSGTVLIFYKSFVPTPIYMLRFALVVFAWKCRLFCLCVHGQCRVYYIYHVEFHFRFKNLLAYPVWHQLSCGCQGEKS